MISNFVETVSEWNPQLFRELKGRLKPFNVLLAVGSSLLLQLIVFLYQLHDFPDDQYPLKATYCRLRNIYTQQQNQLYNQQNSLNLKIENYRQIQLTDSTIIPQLQAQLHQVTTEITNLESFLKKNICPPNEIDWSLFWQVKWEYYFLAFSVIFVFTLSVAGTYLLINDLVREKQRGTMNFIRLSPQSGTSILTGKLLGVPCLIYLFVLTAIPLHFWAGHSANIASSYIFSYYAVLVTSCILFYSAALLFGLVSGWFSNFQPWLGSAGVLVFLLMTMAMASSDSLLSNPLNWVRLLSPWEMINYLFPNLFGMRSFDNGSYINQSSLQDIQFFYFPIGKNLIGLLGFQLIHYGVITYGIWQVIKRCYHNPNATILSKKQSYLFMAFCQVMFLGITMQVLQGKHGEDPLMVAVLNFVLIFGLILILSHPRQTILDWARYRHQNQINQDLWTDLVWGEKSPAVLAIAINLVIASIPLMIWITFFPNYLDVSQAKGFLSVVLFVNLMVIYATVTQLVLLVKNPKRYIWAIGAILTTILLPVTIMLFLDVDPANNPTVWLFSTFPWPAIAESRITTIFIAFLAEFTVLALLNIQLTKQVKILGESATKALLAER
ncbi:ABC transporter permease subunit [Cronbergia sp. UHCC 0137]|uniref:ABC transporter permease subunit n=1 Tax=Cronbergia sp. UHCC 0137 TaxID=3110239 RepID=UPI002B21E759|nr:ABC transporter permease subunit [Cronbergia sp. UHCC 0137]MEA5619226.1 ABC transporter permease subunit [Cronbergia sp. UHCC 0137]